MVKFSNISVKLKEIASNLIGKNIKTTTSGTSGTDYSGGMFYEEYLNKLSSIEGAEEFDQMRRSDDQVAMLLGLVKNLIISARWFISPADEEDEQSKKIADLITHILFKDMGTEDHPKTFEKFKTEALTFADFGYSLFEITNKIAQNHPEFGSYVGLKGLDWRSPKTIYDWDISRGGELLGVEQQDSGEHGGNFILPGKFLLHMAHGMEGDDYEGISMLRPIYGNWLRKEVMLKIQMIGMERSATGVPMGTIPQGLLNTKEQTALEDTLSRLVSHERGWLTVPEGMKVDSLKIKHDADKVDKAIQREDRGMAKRFMAGFLELGLSGGGAFALGTDWSDIFLSGLEVYAQIVTSAVNTKLIPTLVKQNFGKQKKYPELKVEGINDKAGKEFAEILVMLKTNGLLQVTDELKQVVHKKLKLPDFDPDFIEEKEPEDSAKNAQTEKTKLTEAIGRLAEISLSDVEYNLAEKSVGKNIEIIGKEMTEAMQDGMRFRGNRLVELMMHIWRNAPKSQRMKQVNQLLVPDKKEYKKHISDLLVEVYVGATAGVKKELSGDGLKLAEPSEVRDLPAESKAAGASQADLIVESQDADIRKNLFFSFTSKADKLPTEAQMNANLLKVVDRYVTGASIRTGGPNAVANAVNLARNAVFQQKETLEKIQTFVFTNPSPEAPICKELAGRVFSKEEYVVSDKLPPLHHHCNSWIRAQVAGKKGNKPLSPAGLSIQGTDKQIEKINKSITL